MKILTQSVYPTRFGNLVKASEKVNKRQVFSAGQSTKSPSRPASSVPVASLKAYTLSRPALPKFGAMLPGFDLHNFMESDELDFRVSRLYEDARKRAQGDEVTPEDLVLAILKDYLEDAQPDSRHGSSFLGQVLGLHGNSEKFLNSDAGKATIQAVRQATDELEAHLEKDVSPNPPRNKSANMELLKNLSKANQTWQTIKKSTFNPEDMPAFLDEDILLQVFARFNRGKAGEVVKNLTQSLKLTRQFDITPHLSEPEQIVETDNTPTKANPATGIVHSLTREELAEARVGKPRIQGQDGAFQVLTQVLNSTLQAKTLEKLGARATTSALLIGAPGLGKTDLVMEFAETNDLEAVFTLDGKALAQKSPAEIQQVIQHTYAQARERAKALSIQDRKQMLGALAMDNQERVQEIKAQATPPRVAVFFDNLEARLVPQNPEQPGETPLSAFFLKAVQDGGLTEGVMTIGSTTNNEELKQVSTLNLPMMAVVLAAPQLPGDQANVVRELANVFNHRSGREIFPDNLDYESLATRFIGANGRDLNVVLGQALEVALLEQGNADEVKVDSRHLQAAADLKSIGIVNRSALETMPESKKRLIAYHELGHALGQLVMNKMLDTTDSEIERLTIIPQGDLLGFTSVRTTGNHYENSQTGLFSQLVKALASIPAEKLYSNEMHTTPKHDLESANQLAIQYVAQLGMGKNKVIYKPGQQVSNEVEHEINELLNTSQNVASALLNPLAPLIKELAEEVLQKETVSGEFLKGKLDSYLEANPRTYRKMQRSALKILAKAGLFPERIQRTGLLRRRTLAATPFADNTPVNNASTKETQE